MPRECSLDCDFGGLKIADFADQDDVRVLAKEGSKGSREVEADLFLHLHLINSWNVEFDRILRSDDICFRRINTGHCRVKGIGFSASGRAGDQNHTVWLQNGFFQLSQGFRFQAQFSHVQLQHLFVQQAKHDFLAKESREYGYAKIEFTDTPLVFGLNLDSAVLRQAFLCNVQLSHDLYT